MRTGFGRFAQELRARRALSLSEFADSISVSPSRVCNLECGRTSINDDIVGAYIRVLSCSGEDAHELRKLAEFSDSHRLHSGRDSSCPPLLAMLDSFRDRISPKAIAEIQSILERETGERVNALLFSSTRSIAPRSRRGKRPSLTPKRFAEICILAGRIRSDAGAGELSRLKVGRFLEHLAASDLAFDWEAVEHLPPVFSGAFACMTVGPDGHLLLVEEERLGSAERDVAFARHVLAHEVGHHFLHASLLAGGDSIFLAPQELARNRSQLIGSDRQIEQVVDRLEEVEAECFATFLLIPWEAFLKGTEAAYLAKDYGEQLDEVKRYYPHFKNTAALDAFRAILWEDGERSHPIFHI